MINIERKDIHELIKKIDYYREYPENFFEEYLGVKLSMMEKAALKLLMKNYKDGKYFYYLKGRQNGFRYSFKVICQMLYGYNLFYKDVENEDVFVIPKNNKNKPLKVIFENNKSLNISLKNEKDSEI